MKHLVALLVVAFVLVVPAVAQTPDWTQVTTANSPSARYIHAMVYDSVRGKVVMFGGISGDDQTWEYDGVNWMQVTTASSPGARHGHEMVYDSARGKVVLFGGNNSQPGYLNDTWEYDGVNWAQVMTASSPSARTFHAMTYDSVRGKVVVFGGVGSGGTARNDTWEYDGVNWTQVTAASSPSARNNHAMTYDSVRGKVVMFGGYNAGSYDDDTWEYDGVNWTQVMTASSPSARSGHAMTYDSVRAKAVMFGGYDGGLGNYINDTWEFDGVNWTQVTAASSPSAGNNQAMTYDSVRGKVVMFGGFVSGLGPVNDTWEYGGSVPPGPTAEVTAVTLATTATPSPVRDQALATLPSGGAVLFGGETANGPFFPTYELHGTDWTKQLSTNNPLTRTGHSLLLDEARQNNIMFGGRDPLGGKRSDTWTYANGQWSYLIPTTAPSPRSHHAMAYDPSTDTGVLFGGEDAFATAIGDMWHWNGTDWNQATPATLPPARMRHGMAWDRLRDVLVLFGGTDGTTRLDDIWEWDGNDWAQITPAQPNGFPYGPTARDGLAMAYDAKAESVIVIGGETDSGCVDDAWAWDGSAWTLLLPASGNSLPTARKGSQLLFDTSGNRLLLHGGSCGTGFSDELWEIQLPVFARAESIGVGCAGSNGVPTLAIANGTSPVIGTTVDFSYDNGPTFFGITPIMSVGFDDQSFQGLPLPLPLAVLGLPGCTLYHSADVSSSFLSSPIAGEFTWSLALPNNTGFLGQEFFFQGLHIEFPPSANWAALSNAIGIRIGDQ